MSGAVKYLKVESKDKTSNSINNSNFNVNIPYSQPVQNIKSITTYQAWVPNVFYNVNENNNTINITQGAGSPMNVSISVGQYNINSLITAYTAAINSALTGATVAITQGNISNKLTFTYTGALVSLNFPTALASSSAIILGFPLPVASSAVWVAPNLPNLRGQDQVYIHSRQLNGAGFIDSDSTPISAVAAVSFNNVSFGQVGYLQTTLEDAATIRYPDTRNLSQIQIILRDGEGNQLDIGSDNMTLILRIET